MKQAVSTSAAALAKGPYSQAIISGDLVFVSGQVALDTTGQLISGTIEEETHQVMANLQSALTAAGLKFDDVVKTTIYLVDTSLFTIVNDVYGSYLTNPFPARETIGVASLPLGARIEISMIASLK